MENRYLQIQGIVDRTVLNELIDVEKYAKPNTEWLFVDYSPVQYKLNTKFDIILAGEEKKMLPKFFNIKLLDAFEQTGKKLDCIPLGWKTICRFECKPIPAAVLKLPVLSSWTYTSELKFARHEDIVVDPFNISKSVYSEVLNDFISMSIHTDSINKKSKEDLLDILSKVISGNTENIAHKITNPGLIVESKRKELHLSH